MILKTQICIALRLQRAERQANMQKMKTVVSKRTLARIVSFSLAIIAVLGASNIIYMNRLRSAGNKIEYGYMLAVEDLAESADKLSVSLTKGMYSASEKMLSELSSELISDSYRARDALSRLPVSDVDLEKTEKFFSQVGNYASALAKKASDGDEPSYEDYSKMNMLCESAQKLSELLWQMRAELLSSDSSVTELFKEVAQGADSLVGDGFAEIEDAFENTPKLIYDGPYSDHILDKEPRMCKDAPEVSGEDAIQKAAQSCGVEAWELKESEYPEDSKMPSYRFEGDGVSCAVTQNGGYICYMLKSRHPSSSEITPEEAKEYAQAYLESLGIQSMETTYYESYDNVCTINFAYNDDGVTCYTDLIKVAVALDNGEILGFDARGFIVNHYDRRLEEPALSVMECQEKLSPMLSVVGSSLAVIPSDSVEEKLCREFKCQSSDGKTVLVYVNCQTGDEEDILILRELEGSVLTV